MRVFFWFCCAFYYLSMYICSDCPDREIMVRDFRFARYPWVSSPYAVRWGSGNCSHTLVSHYSESEQFFSGRSDLRDPGSHVKYVIFIIEREICDLLIQRLQNEFTFGKPRSITSCFVESVLLFFEAQFMNAGWLVTYVGRFRTKNSR